MLQSAFADLPDSLLHRVFSAEGLSFIDKVECEAVCTSRRKLLRCQEPEDSRHIWSENFEIRESIHHQDWAGGVTFRCDLTPIVCLSGKESFKHSKRDSLLAWLLQTYTGFRTITLSMPHTSWNTAAILAALHNMADCLCFPPKPQVSISAGAHYFALITITCVTGA